MPVPVTDLAKFERRPEITKGIFVLSDIRLLVQIEFQ